MRVGKTKIVSLLSFNISVSPPARLYVLYRMLTFIRHLYECNDIWSLLTIADLTLQGIGTKTNPFEAVRIWNKTYQQGYKFSNYNLAVAYYYGIGADKDTSKALAFLEEVKDIDGDAYALYTNITQNKAEKFLFRFSSSKIDENSLLGAEKHQISLRNINKAIQFYKQNPSKESFFWLARLYKDGELENSNEIAEEYFHKALEANHPYAKYIETIYKNRGCNFEDYDLYEPYYLNDLIDLFISNKENIYDKIFVIYAAIKGSQDINDTSLITKEWEKLLYKSISPEDKIKENRLKLFERCLLRNSDELINECQTYIWELLEEGKENTLLFPAKTFIDILNKTLVNSKTICYYDNFSLKYLKFLNKDKEHIFFVSAKKTFILGNFIAEILGLKNVRFLHEDKEDKVHCDTFVKIPNLYHKKNQELNIRTSDLSQRLAIINTLRNKEKIKKAVVLVNREFCSSLFTEEFFTKAKLGQIKAFESVIELDKDLFCDIDSSTSLLVLNFEKENDNVTFIKGDRELIVPFDKIYENALTLNFELYIQDPLVEIGTKITKFIDIIEFRSDYDKPKKDENEYRKKILSSKDYSASLLSSIYKKNSLSRIEKENKPKSIIREYYGPHIFLNYKNGVNLNIQTEDCLCEPGYDSYAIRLKENSQISLEYLAYLLMSKDMQDYISDIVDKNGRLMPRDILYKKVAIHTDKNVQKRIVEEALVKERQRMGSGVEYNVVVISKNPDVINFFSQTEGLTLFGKDLTFEEIFAKYIEDKSKAMVDAIVVDSEDEESYDVLEDFGDIRERNIHLYLLSDNEDYAVKGKKKSKYFIEENRVFNLNEDGQKQLINKLRDDLDSSNSYQAKIRMQHKDVFEAADSLDKKHGLNISKVIMRYIQNGYVIDHAEDTPFDQLRHVCHTLLKKLATDYGLVPLLPKEGAIAKLLANEFFEEGDGRNKKQYLMLQPIMNKFLAKSLDYFCFIANNTIHGQQDSSKLGTAALNILMEFILWFYKADVVNNELERYKDKKTFVEGDDVYLKFKNRKFTVNVTEEGKCYIDIPEYPGIGIFVQTNGELTTGSEIMITDKVGHQTIEPKELGTTRIKFFVSQKNYRIL